jgi:hypothetical protein
VPSDAEIGREGRKEENDNKKGGAVLQMIEFMA